MIKCLGFKAQDEKFWLFNCFNNIYLDHLDYLILFNLKVDWIKSRQNLKKNN